MMPAHWNALAARISSNISPAFCLGLITTTGLVVFASYFSEIFHIPAVVIALGLGILLRWAVPALVVPTLDGVGFCSRQLLKAGIALLGLRVSAENLLMLGTRPLAIILLSLLSTLAGGYVIARVLRQRRSCAAISTISISICGASAALAASSVLPQSDNREKQTGFVILVVSLLSTIVMLLYPAFGHMLQLNDREMAILLGGAIHDVAQVAGAGFSISPEMGVEAVMIKMVRVACLLPVVACLAILSLRRTESAGSAVQIPMPWFLVGFLSCAVVSSFGLAPAAVVATGADLAILLILAAVGAIGLQTRSQDFRAVSPLLIVTMIAQTIWKFGAVWLLIRLIL